MNYPLGIRTELWGSWEEGNAYKYPYKPLAEEEYKDLVLKGLEYVLEIIYSGNFWCRYFYEDCNLPIAERWFADKSVRHSDRIQQMAIIRVTNYGMFPHKVFGADDRQGLLAF